MSDSTGSQWPVPAPRQTKFACALAYAGAWGMFIANERLWANRGLSAFSSIEKFLAAEVDTLVTLALLLVAPIAWFWRSREGEGRPARGLRKAWQAGLDWAAGARTGSHLRAFGLSLVVVAASLGASAWVGGHFDGLPPAYHDEYSYLFQARTYLAGRLSFPSHELAPLFDQMHVVNEGRFASRYFPGTGLWMAPFVRLGDPWLGHWVAGALSAWLIFWCGRELAGDFAGLLAGLLTAVSPGMAFFSNFLLAHHPTLVGLSLFLLAYLRAVRRGSAGWGIAAGVGLAFAALCRPMTAASVGLPFGIHLLGWWLARSSARPLVPVRERRMGVVLAIGAPLLAGGAFMFLCNRAITGNGWTTSYGLYTRVYTPRHVYGFNNVVRGGRISGPRVIEKYDKWAVNLTPRLAARVSAKRLVYSCQWTLGLIPLTLALVAGLVWWPTLEWATRLLLLGIASLHLAHVPYWFSGMLNHHYVFESAPLWLLWTAVVTVRAFGAWKHERRWWLPGWWLCVLASAVVLNYAVRSGRWSAPLDKGLIEARFSREKHRQFQELIAREILRRPALVLIDEDPADVHIDFVNNDPSLTGEVLLGKYLPGDISEAEIRSHFPDRALYLYRAREGWMERLPSAASPGGK